MGGARRPTTRAWTLVAAAIAITIVNIDLSALTVALPTLQHDLGTRLESAQWVLNGYLLALAALVIPAGRLSDIVGRRRMFLLALGALGVASVVGALADSIGVLIVARVLQGAAAAVLLPGATALVAAIYEPEARRAPISDLLIVASIAAALGPLVGGLLTETLGWQAVFAVNVPLCAVAALAVWRVPETRDENAPTRIDAVGVLLLAAGLVAVVLAFDQADVWGWISVATWGLFAAGIALLVGFAVYEHHQPAPLLKLALFRRSKFVGPVVVGLLVFFAAIPFDLFIAQYAQRVLGYGPLEAGLVLLPSSVAVGIAAPIASRAGDRFGSRGPIIAGTALIVVALLLSTSLDVDTSFAQLAIPVVLIGFGLGSSIGLVGTAAINAVDTGEAGAAAGISHMARMLGASLGVAIALTMFQVARTDRLDVLAAGSRLRGSAAVHDAFVFALQPCMLIMAGAVAVGGLVAALTVRDPPRAPAADPAPAV